MATRTSLLAALAIATLPLGAHTDDSDELDDGPTWENGNDAAWRNGDDGTAWRNAAVMIAARIIGGRGSATSA